MDLFNSLKDFHFDFIQLTQTTWIGNLVLELQETYKVSMLSIFYYLTSRYFKRNPIIYIFEKF